MQSSTRHGRPHHAEAGCAPRPTVDEKLAAALEHRHILEERLVSVPESSREVIELQRCLADVLHTIDLHMAVQTKVRRQLFTDIVLIDPVHCCLQRCAFCCGPLCLHHTRTLCNGLVRFNQ